MTTSIDPKVVKQQMKQSWDGAAAGWKKWLGVLAPASQPVSETLLDLAEVGEGKWVLDVATGIGEPALTAAKRVGPQGKVVGIDLSKRMLAVAEERARAAGLTNVSFQEGDAETLGSWPEKSYEAVVCRWGLMFLPQLGTALRGIHRVLTTGSAFATAVWAAEDRVPLIAVANRVVGDVISLPRTPPGGLGPFALSAPDALEHALTDAGFRGVRSERVTVVFVLANAQTYADFVKDASHLSTLIAEQGPHAHEQINAGLVEAAAGFADADGKVSFICDTICAVGKRA